MIDGINKIFNPLTDKVEHHLGAVEWSGGDAQQLVSLGHSGVVDCLDVDVVPRHHDVADLSVLLSICHLQNKQYIHKHIIQ